MTLIEAIKTTGVRPFAESVAREVLGSLDIDQERKDLANMEDATNFITEDITSSIAAGQSPYYGDDLKKDVDEWARDVREFCVDLFKDNMEDIKATHKTLTDDERVYFQLFRWSDVMVPFIYNNN